MITTLINRWISGTQKDFIAFMTNNPGLTIEVMFDPTVTSDKPPGATVQRYIFRLKSSA